MSQIWKRGLTKLSVALEACQGFLWEAAEVFSAVMSGLTLFNFQKEEKTPHTCCHTNILEEGKYEQRRDSWNGDTRILCKLWVGLEPGTMNERKKLEHTSNFRCGWVVSGEHRSKKY